MSAVVPDAFGDPAYLDGALGRMETGQPLRPVDLQELSYAIGREAALKLQRTAEEDRARRMSAPAKSRGLWGWLTGGPVQQASEVDPHLLDLIQRIRSGQLVRPSDVTRIPKRVGRRIGRGVEGAVERSRSKAASRTIQRRETTAPRRAERVSRRFVSS